LKKTKFTSFNLDLLHWYDRHKRDLPWRKTKDPYQIWLSEIMLQQTQVDTVIPYYNRWIETCPTLHDVAKLSLDQLLKLWEGLGYYSRCRNFYKAVHLVNSKFNGVIPSDQQQFIKLPGVGEYTANAVLSIAFDQPLPAMDGNIKRVMSRVLGIKTPSKYNLSRIKNKLIKWIDIDRPGDFNQALMDVGANICRPQNTKCEICPIAEYCSAKLSKNPVSYPLKTVKKKTPHIQVVGGMVWYKDKFLILKRHEDKMLGGLWEFPSKKIISNQDISKTLQSLIFNQTGLNVQIQDKIGSVNHTYSHFSMTFTVYHCLVGSLKGFTTDQETNWVQLEEIDQYPFPKANQKIFELL